MEDANITKVSKRPFLVALTKQGYTFEEAVNIYESFMKVLLDEVLKGNEVTLTGFGNFMLKYHKGHPVQFTDRDKDSVGGYLTLKFVTSTVLNKRLRSNTELIEKIKKRTTDSDKKE